MNEAPIESTTRLIREAHSGDGAARDRLFERCRPLLRRWARGRLPHFARDLADTEDLVQTAMTRAFTNFDRFEARGTGSFLAYLRTITLNAVKEELRRSGRRPEDTERFEAADASTNPVLQDAISADTLADYEAGLERLDEPRRQAVVLRLEFGLSYAEIAEELELASADAARMKVARALVRLAEVMRSPGESSGSH